MRRRESERQDSALAAGLQKRLRAAQDGLAADEKQAALRRQPVAAPAQAVSAWINAHTTTVHESDLVRDHPEYLDVMIWQKRRNVMRQYGAGLDDLGLPPEQITKLKDLLAERQTSSTKAIQASMAAGLKPGAPEWDEALKQAQAPVDQEIGTAFRTDGSQLVGRLQQAVTAQTTVQDTYAPDFDDAGAGMSPEQSRGLARALAEAAYPATGPAAPPGYDEADPATHLSPHDSRILAGAARGLNSAQLGVLQADLVQSQQEAAILRQYTGGLTSGYRVDP